MKNKQFFILSSLLLLTLALLPVAQAAETPQDQLSQEAREPFNKGMIAVEQNEWLVAIRYFERAQKIGTYAPIVLFNLGLAESKIPNRELRALAWLHAYLVVAPNSSNAEAVREEIASLDVKAEATLLKLIRQSKQLAGQLDNVFVRSDAYLRVALELAKIGDNSGAEQTAKLSRDPSELEMLYGAEGLEKKSNLSSAMVFQHIAWYNAALGNYEEAREQIRKYPAFAPRETCLKHIDDLEAESKKIKIEPDDSSLKYSYVQLLALGTLNKPIYTDLNETLQIIAARKEPEEIFNGYMKLVEDMAMRLEELRNNGEIWHWFDNVYP
jgi:tetratricopeptide (TPR) repeat protein